MKAMYYEESGGNDVFHYGDVPDPVPGPGDVVVDVAAVVMKVVEKVFREVVTVYLQIKKHLRFGMLFLFLINLILIIIC